MKIAVFLLLFSCSASAVNIIQDEVVAGGGVTFIEASDAVCPDAATGTLDFTLTAAATSGRTAVILVSNDNAGLAGTYFSMPAGWTALEVGYGDNITDTKGGIFYRTLDGSEGGTVAATSITSTDFMCGYILIFENVDSVVGVTPTLSTANVDTLLVAAGTSTVDNSIAVSFATFDGADGVPVVLTSGGPGWVIEDADYSGGVTQTNSKITAAWLSKSVSSAGSTGDYTIDFDGTDGTMAGGLILQP